MTSLWELCRERIAIGQVGGDLVRLVESQEPLATSTLVDGLAEQVLLEAMLEATKPPLRSGTDRLHFLLSTPFRYPPLRHGSRFGTRCEPSLFYGSKGLTTVLAEAAYYRFVFRSAMVTPPPSPGLLTQHTVLGARYRSASGLRLQQPPCAAYEALLRQPSDYTATQHLGRAMREAGIGAFEYVSARDPTRGINVALFEPAALVSRKPLFQQAWLCETRSESVSFSTSSNRQAYVFVLTQFLVDGRLPRPAD